MNNGLGIDYLNPILKVVPCRGFQVKYLYLTFFVIGGGFSNPRTGPAGPYEVPSGSRGQDHAHLPVVPPHRVHRLQVP